MDVPDSTDMDREGVAFASLKFTKLGYIFREQAIVDIGIDAHIELKHGNVGTGQLIGLQIKAGLSYFKEENKSCFVYRGNQAHLDYWLGHSLPTIIVLYHPEFEELYWAIISEEKITSTGKGWKLQIPKRQKVNVGIHIDIERLVSKVSAFKTYTIVSTRDVSDETAKRYDVRVVLNKDHSQSEILDLCKNLVVDVKQQNYYRSNLTLDRWKEENAHIVWLMLYPSHDDENNHNHVAIVQWVSPNLSAEYTFDKVQGENIGDGVIIYWNNNYPWVAELYDKNTTCKADFIKKTDLVITKITDVMNEAEVLVRKLEDESITNSFFSEKMFDVQKSIGDSYYLYLMEAKFPPFECKDLNKQILAVVALAETFSLPYNKWNPTNCNGEFDLNFHKNVLQEYKEHIEKYALERKKVESLLRYFITEKRPLILS